ncbi:MAG: hypothetical protein GY906_24385 [bacterium]|nr:hypothetical protein [bacterium]
MYKRARETRVTGVGHCSGYAGRKGTLVLHQDFIGTTANPIITLAAAVKKGPSIIFTRASANGTYFDSAGVLQTAGTDVARFDHDPATGLLLGFRSEEARTNVLLRSEELGTAWTLGGTTPPTLDTDASGAPDGNTTADEVTFGGSANSKVTQRVTAGTSASTEYKISVYGKLVSGVPTFRFNFLDNGSGGNQSSGNLTATSSWQRFSFTATFGDGAIRDIDIRNNVAGDAGVILFWGGQLEEADFNTSYIATAGATATRAADVASYSFSPGTGFVWRMTGRTAAGGGTQVLGQLDDGGGTPQDNSVRLLRNASDEIHLVVTDGGGTQADITIGTVADDTDFKVAVRVKANDFHGALDGTLAGTPDTSGTVDGSLSQGWIGQSDTGEHWFGTVSNNKIWDDAGSNGFLEGITS